MINIRKIKSEDAANFLNLNLDLDDENKFMMLEPDEREHSVKKQKERIAGSEENINCVILVAEEGGKLIGYIEATGGEYRRNRHKVHIVIGILKKYSGKGIGTRLFEHLEKWARVSGIIRLELTVMKHNERAVGLYKKMGFLIEGEIRNSLIVDKKYVNEYFMSKIVD